MLVGYYYIIEKRKVFKDMLNRDVVLVYIWEFWVFIYLGMFIEYRDRR